MAYEIQLDNFNMRAEPIKVLAEKVATNVVKQVSRFLPANRTSSLTDVPEMRITGLTIGKSYEVATQCYITSSSASGASMFVKHNGSSLHRYNYDSAGANFAGVASGNSTKFKATNTEINVDMSLGTGTEIVGDGTAEGTWIRVTELEYDLQVVSSF